VHSPALARNPEPNSVHSPADAEGVIMQAGQAGSEFASAVGGGHLTAI